MSLCVITKVFPGLERIILLLSNRVKQVILFGPLGSEDEGTTVLQNIRDYSPSDIPENVHLQQHCCGKLKSHYRHAFQVPCLRPPEGMLKHSVGVVVMPPTWQI
jgi:hypothetical protein